MERVKDTTTIASKISRIDKQKLHTIANDLGLTFYSLIQSIMLTIIRYCDKGGNVSAEHSTLIDAFGLVLKSTVGSHIPISVKNSDRDNIKSAILFVERGAGKRPQLMEVSKDGYGKLVESYNYDTMLSSFLTAIDPDVQKKLSIKAKDMGYFSITAALRSIILESVDEQYTIEKDINNIFSDIRISTGQAVNDEVHYNRGYRKNLDEYTTITPNPIYRADI